MLNTLRKVLAAPTFPDDENRTRSAYYINAVTLFSAPVVFAIIIVRILVFHISIIDLTNLILLGIISVQAIGWVMMRSGAVQLAGYFNIIMVWLAGTFLAFTGSGLRGSGFLSYFVVILLAGLLVGGRGALSMALLSMVSAFALAAWESAGRLMDPADPPFEIAWETAGLFLLCTVIVWLIISSLRRALEITTANSKQLETANIELSELRDVLETRIQERTESLEKRASQLKTLSRVARTIVSIQDLSILLPSITGLVSEQFGFYHAGIFLLDDSGTKAILKAASSEGGRRMLARVHELPLDSTTIVGSATASSEPRVALEIAADAAQVSNPDLPETRSEIALPLRVSGKVIGALDVQSKDTNAFTTDDIDVLSTLADQIAIAIENARLFGESQRALSESRSTFERYVKQDWSNFAQQVRHTGYSFDGKHVIPMDSSAKRDQPRAALQTGSLILEKGAVSSISIPIKLRGQVIGILDVRSKKGPREWSREELVLLEAAAERAALALENARLLESAQRRAARERTIGEISAKIGSASDFNSILRTTVEEMGRRIGAAEVIFELGPGTSRNGGEQ
jgi:GAF domain-containing protein